MIRFPLYLLASALLPTLLACASPSAVAQPALLLGRLTLDGAGAPGVAAALTPVGGPLGPAAPPAATTVSGAGGEFSFSVPAGSYYLTAASGDHAGYDGRNPLSLPPGRTTAATVPLVPYPGPAAPAEAGTVGGTVRLGPAPLPDALVTAYGDALGGLRGPGVASTTTGPDGTFRLDLGPGRYFLVARARRAADGVGPLVAGDRFAYYPRNPLTLAEGEGADVTLQAVTIPDRGISRPADPGSAIVVTGRVVTREGRPVSGYWACVFDNAAQVNRPLAFSGPTGPDGAFRLEIPGPGSWYLGARPRLGGPPAPGETPAWYRDGEPVPLAWGDRLEGVALVLGEPLP